MMLDAFDALTNCMRILSSSSHYQLMRSRLHRRLAMQVRILHHPWGRGGAEQKTFSTTFVIVVGDAGVKGLCALEPRALLILRVFLG